MRQRDAAGRKQLRQREELSLALQRTLDLGRGEGLTVIDNPLPQAGGRHLPQRIERMLVCGDPLQVGMKEVRHFEGKVVETAVERGVVLVLVPLQALQVLEPYHDGIDLAGVSLAFGGLKLLFLNEPPVLLQEVFPGSARLAAHGVPHLEFFDRLLKCNLHPQLLGMQVQEQAQIDREQRPVRAPRHGLDAGERFEEWRRLDRPGRRWPGPDQVAAAVEPVEVFRK
jgi:hypothetical protein